MLTFKPKVRWTMDEKPSLHKIFLQIKLLRCQQQLIKFFYFTHKTRWQNCEDFLHSLNYFYLHCILTTKFFKYFLSINSFYLHYQQFIFFQFPLKTFLYLTFFFVLMLRIKLFFDCSVVRAHNFLSFHKDIPVSQ